MPKRVAIVATIYEYLSHGQHIGDRFLVGYPWEGRWRKPDLQVVSLYVDQKPKGDLSAERAREFGFPVYPTIAETLRCGGDKLAVDAALIIGEHGDYPDNEIGQKLYPRYEFFKQCVAVFEKDGRTVPVYNDKHLSYSFEKAKWMVDQSRRLGFPMLAGSSIPVTWRLPDVDMPYGAEVQEALAVGFGRYDHTDFHALEGMQCMIERRKGGETGVRRVELLEGDAVWKAADARAWSNDLLVAALSRSDTPGGLTREDGRTQDLVTSGQLRKITKNPSAWLIERNDGLKTTLLMLPGTVKDFTFAARLKGRSAILSTQFFASPEPNVTYSACLAHKVAEMFETGKAPYPVERTLLVTGIIESGMRSRGRAVETPHLAVRYRGPAASQYARS
ncbi:MAG: hypothetical protein FJW38_12635 [Acidobacteria bacterium]|nr:hypothetical protein [Acidobacteriota bacterium]